MNLTYDKNALKEFAFVLWILIFLIHSASDHALWCYTAVPHILVQYSAMHYSAIQCHPLWYNTAPYIMVQYSAKHYGAKQCHTLIIVLSIQYDHIGLFLKHLDLKYFAKVAQIFGNFLG